MIAWTEFEKREPDLAAAGRDQFYQHGLGLGFLATVRRDGGPRVHPVCPVIGDHGLHLVILPGPKLADLRRDGRYSMHSEFAYRQCIMDSCEFSSRDGSPARCMT